MPLEDALNQAAAALERFGSALSSIAREPIRIELAATGSIPPDRIDAEAIKRGQRPELIAALRQALGL